MIYPVEHLPQLGKGAMLLDIFDENGLPTGYQHLGNCSTIEQEIKDDKAELYQHLHALPSLIATAIKKRTISLKMIGTDFSADHLAIAEMAGSKTVLEIAATPVAGEILASATAKKKGRYFATVGRNLDPSTVAIGGLVAGTDFIIADAVQGMIYFPLTSNVDETAAIAVDYTPIATTFDQIAGAVKQILKGKLRFVPDPTDGQHIGVEWWKCNLTPSGKLELVKDDYGNWELDVLVLEDAVNHPDCPYYQKTFY